MCETVKTLTGYPSIDKPWNSIALQANLLKELDQEIHSMIASKQNKSQPYVMPENLTGKAYRALRDLEENHDNSWAVEIHRRNERGMDKIALLYRGRKITYREMFVQSYLYAKALKEMGVKKYDEIPVLVSNIPEYMYLFLALSFIGARMNTVGVWFHPDYLKEIISNSGSHIVFVSDDCYESIKTAVETLACVDTVVMFSLTDSLPSGKDGTPYNPYQSIDDRFHSLCSRVSEYQKSDKRIIDLSMFLKSSGHYSGTVVEDMKLDDIAAITYTSGTTKPGYPKGCIHSNRNYLAISRFKVSDVSDMPAMKNIIALAHLPSYTQTVLTTAYSDSLYLGCTVALEPFFGEEFFPYTLEIYHPNYAVATPGYFLYLAKKLNADAEWQSINMPYLMLPIIVGEPTSLGEEKYLNETAKKHKFGTEKLPFPFAPITFSYGGGSTENGGIFITLFKALQEKKPSYFLAGEHMQLKTLPLADVEVLTSDGQIAPVGMPGMLVANSPCNQIGYVNDTFNTEMHLTDTNGKTWYSAGSYALKNRFGDIRIVNRPRTNIPLPSGASLPLYQLEDAVNADFKSIMSAVIVKVNERYVCHIEKQPGCKLNNDTVLRAIAERLKKTFDYSVLKLFYLRIRTFEESYPLAPSGKRDIAKLTDEGIDKKCVAFISIK